MRAPRSPLLVVAVLLVALIPAVSQAAPDDLVAELERAEARLAELDTQVSIAVEDYNAAAARLERLQVQQDGTRARIDALTSKVAALEDATAAFVRQMYIRGPATDLTVALEADEVNEAGRDLAVMDRLSRQRHADVEQLGVSRSELQSAEQALSVQVAEAADRQTRLATARDQVEEVLASQRVEVSDLDAEIQRIRAQEAAEAERRRREAAEQAALAAAARQAAEAAEAVAEPAVAEPEPPPPPPPPVPPPPPPGTRQGADAAVDAAMSQLGKPYRYAAAGPDAYDCSGLTQWAWARAGVSLPHSSRMQYSSTTRVSRDQLQPGDLVFYGSPIHHVAMYLDGTRVIEAPYTGANVRIREDGLLRSDIAGYGRP